MDSETIEGFSKYRLNKAKETLETARMIFNEGKDFTSANNRAYYAIFYAIRAVLAIEEVDFKRHKDVLAYFSRRNESEVLISANDVHDKIIIKNADDLIAC